MGEAGLDIQAAVHHVNIIGAEMEQIHIQRTVERKQNRERENARIEAMRKQAAALVLQEKNCAMQGAQCKLPIQALCIACTSLPQPAVFRNFSYL